MTATKTKTATSAPAEILDVAERLANVVDELAELKTRLRWDKGNGLERDRTNTECSELQAGYLLQAAIEEIEIDLDSGGSTSANALRRDAAVLRDVIALIRTREKVTA